MTEISEEVTNKEAKAKIETALKELLQVVALEDLAEANIINHFEGETREGKNFSGSLEVEKSEKDAHAYHMKIRMKIE